MKRILFCDDEPNVTDGLKRMLRRYRREWDMAFVNSGREALERMARDRFDVLVTDMKMPGMDGVELLERVKENHPETVRIVLSGYSELEASLRAVPVAHQFLTKPCEPDVLRSVVERALALQNLLDEDRLKKVLGGIQTLPSLPKVYHELSAALVDPEVEVEKIAALVEQDPAVSMKVLQLVNSSFFALPHPVADMKQAVAYLGMNMLRNLVLALGVFQELRSEDERVHGFLQKTQEHSMLTARIAEKLIRKRSQAKNVAEFAFMAGLSHDIGRMVLALSFGEGYEEVMAFEAAGEWFVADREEEILGVSHAEVGGYLLGLWGLPYPVVEAVANHHRPSRVPAEGYDTLAAVHCADILAHLVTGQDGSAPEDHLDRVFLERVGGLDDLDGDLALARELSATVAGPVG